MDKLNILIEKFHKQISNILGTDEWCLINKKFDTIFSEKLTGGEYELIVWENESDKLASKFELIPMINCCGILVSTKAYVDNEYRDRGLGTLLNQVRIDIARYLGYGILLCTNDISNEPQQKILTKNGWKQIFKFVNPRTKNTIGIHIINL